MRWKVGKAKDSINENISILKRNLQDNKFSEQKIPWIYKMWKMYKMWKIHKRHVSVSLTMEWDAHLTNIWNVYFFMKQMQIKSWILLAFWMVKQEKGIYVDRSDVRQVLTKAISATLSEKFSWIQPKVNEFCSSSQKTLFGHLNSPVHLNHNTINIRTFWNHYFFFKKKSQ